MSSSTTRHDLTRILYIILWSWMMQGEGSSLFSYYFMHGKIILPACNPFELGLDEYVFPYL